MKSMDYPPKISNEEYRNRRKDVHDYIGGYVVGMGLFTKCDEHLYRMVEDLAGRHSLVEFHTRPEYIIVEYHH